MSNPQRVATTVMGSMLGRSSETESTDASCDGSIELNITVEGSHDDMFESSLVPSAAISNKNSTSDTLFDRIEVSAPEIAPEGVQVSGTNKIMIDLSPLSGFEHPTRGHSKANPSRKALTSGGETGKIDEQTTLDTTFDIAYRPINPPPYNVPCRHAFVDEDEFEQQMNAEFRVGEEAGLSQTGSFSDVDACEAISHGTTKDKSDDFQDSALIEVLDKQVSSASRCPIVCRP